MAARTDYNENFAERAEKTAALVKDANYKQQRDAREKKQRQKDTMNALVRGAIGLAIIMVGVFFLDGGRREYAELFAHVLTFVPATSVERGTSTHSEQAQKQMNLAHRDVVITDQKGTATLSFPDGSGVLVRPDTRFEVRLIDYARSGVRDRNFFLRFGNVFSRISKRFGTGGQTLISTPNAVAAARGTAYSVQFEAQSGTTVVDVIESKVVLKSAGGRIEISAGQRGIVSGSQSPQLSPLDPLRRRMLMATLNQMRKQDKPLFPAEAAVAGMERGLFAALDPVLQTVGLVPGGWNIQDNDNARRLQAKKRLEDLQKALIDDLPEQLTLHTLAELTMPPEERDRVLTAFAGEMLDSYEKRGPSGYLIRARARDSKHTPYELTETGVRELKK